MNTYTCETHRPVQAEDMREAAKIFADRKAKAKYGRRGHARTCEMRAYAQDMRLAEWSAFIGITTGHETTGNQVQFTVCRA
jgi:hypothetical protein